MRSYKPQDNTISTTWAVTNNTITQVFLWVKASHYKDHQDHLTFFAVPKKIPRRTEESWSFVTPRPVPCQMDSCQMHPLDEERGKATSYQRGGFQKTLPRVATGVGITHQTAKIHALGVWVYFVKAGFSHIRLRFFHMLPSICPSNSGSKWICGLIQSLQPISAESLPLDVAGGKKDDTSCVVAEVVEWTKEAGEVTCFAELKCFCKRSAPIHDMDGWFNMQWQSRFVCLVALRCGCGCGLLWLCLYIHILYLIYTWFVWWFLLWLPSSLLSWSVLVTWRTCKNFGCQSSCLVWLN